MSEDSIGENIKDSSSPHHTAFAYLFLFVACISLYRVYIYYDFSHRGKVVTIFYSLIFFTSLLRSIWFFLFSFSNIYYIPLTLTTITDVGAGACLLSQILSSLGSIGLYLIFILIACYWFQLLRDTSTTANARSTAAPNNNIRSNDNKNRGTQFNAVLDETDEEDGNSYGITRYLEDNNISMIPLFFVCSVILIFLNLINLILYMLDVFNSEDMILYDSVILSIVSLITLIVFSKLSKKIKKLLIMIGAINNNSTQAQIRRIVAITYAANCFFVVRVGIELSLLVSFLILYINHQSLTVILVDRYWDVYVVLKYSFELAILALELIISTAIKTYATTGSNSSAHHSHQYQHHHSHGQQQQHQNQNQQYNSVAPPTRSSGTGNRSSGSTTATTTALNINKDLESKAVSAATSSGIQLTTQQSQQQQKKNSNNLKSSEQTPLLPTTSSANQTFNI